MSLVNEMLQDLQQRKAADSKPLAGLHAVPAATRSVPRRLSGRPWLMVLPVIVVAVAVSLWWRVQVASNAVQASTASVEPDLQPIVNSDRQPVPVSDMGPSVVSPPPAPETRSHNAVAFLSLSEKLSVPKAVVTRPTAVRVVKPVKARSVNAAPVVRPADEVSEIVVRTPVSSAARLRRDGLAALRAGRAVEAQRLFEKLVAVEPLNTESYIFLHAALKAQSSTAAGRRILLNGLERTSQPARLARVLASELLADGNVDQALGVLMAHRPSGYADLDYEAQLAAVTQRAGNHEAATDIYQLLVSRQPANGVWWAGLGISQEASGNAGDAARSFSAATAGGTLDSTLATYVAQRLKTLEHGS